jgi:serine/threonine protein kinase
MGHNRSVILDVGVVLAGRYELRQLIGRGGMGEVYQAFDGDLERDVAIKSLLPHLARDPDLVARFRHEGRALARLRHPGIIALYDMLRIGEDGLYLVLEYVPGRPLDRALSAGPLGWGRVADIGVQVCAALTAAHAQGIVHRDIKPSNILLEHTGRVRVADFGLARLAGAGLLTRTGMQMGTPGYWAPEQALGRGVTGRTDIYSLSAVMFEAVTGRLPFVAEDDGQAAILMHVLAPVPDPREVNPALPEDVCRILMRGLATDPENRFGTAEELAAELRLSATPTPAASLGPPDRSGTLPQTLAGEGPAFTSLSPVAPVGPPTPTEVSAGTEVAAPPAAGEPARGAPDETPAQTPPTRIPERRAGAARRRRMHPPTPVLGAGIAAVVVAAIGGGLLGSSTSGADPSPAPLQRVASGLVSLQLPGDWTSLRQPVIPGLTFIGEPIARAAVGEAAGDAELIAGRVAATGPTLLPESLRRRLGGSPEAEAVRIGPLQALRYRDLPAGDDGGLLTIYAVPTTRGVAVVACRFQAAAATAFRPQCDGAAASLRLRGARPYGVGPSAAYARRLNAAIAALSRERAVQRRALASAELPGLQATAAKRLASAYAAAADALRGADLGPAGAGRNEAIRAALARGDSAHQAMSRAAARDDGPGYETARRAAALGDRDLRVALASLRALGYR